ncbi:MAG: CRISPR-associated endonuclease Cas1 [Candidatus Nitrosotenuis sp.]
MNPLLISGFGTSINVDKRKLVVTNRLKNQRLEFNPHRIEHDSIIIDGHTGNISFESMRWLMKHNIHLTLLNWDGNLLATTIPESTISGKLRIKQYQKYLDIITRHEIAHKIVQSKVDSSLHSLKELSRFYPIDYKKVQKGFASETAFFEAKRQKGHDFTELLGYEGRIARIYFDNIKAIFDKIAPEFSFESRSNYDHKRADHASDEINALLNYGYSILASEIRKFLNSIGLDPQIGFLHEILSSRTPLVYDFQELFRWMIDLSVIQLLEETPKLKKTDFIVTENYHIRLREDTAKRLVDKIRFNFNGKAPYKAKNFTYQNILYDNMQQLAHFISERKKSIKFVVPKIEIIRDDTTLLREKILSMMPQERKRLGINKSTLWYLKKNIISKDKVKIYDKILDKLKE